MVVKYEQLPARPVPYAEVQFPIPRLITSLRLAEVPRKLFSRPEAILGNDDPQHVSTLEIFTYDIEDECSLCLRALDGDGHYWEPAFNGNYVNLHFFASEDHFHKLPNSREDFNQCMELLGYHNLLNTRLLPEKEIPNPDVLPPGVVVEETETLAVRTRRLARLGRILSRNNNTREPWQLRHGDANLAWHGNDALDGSDEACGHGWGGEGGL